MTTWPPPRIALRGKLHAGVICRLHWEISAMLYQKKNIGKQNIVEKRWHIVHLCGLYIPFNDKKYVWKFIFKVGQPYV